MPRTNLEHPLAASIPATSLRIIAAAIVIASMAYASSIIITFICAIFIAFVLEPGVRFLERFRMPRWVGALVMVVVMLSVFYLAGYFLYDRAAAFLADLPKFAEGIKQIIARVQLTARNLRQSTTNILPPSPESTLPTVRLQQESPWMQFLLRGIGSVYTFAVTVMFVPFLVFFMLTSKHQLWAATLNLFPSQRRQEAEDVIDAISGMVRQYVLGNVLVAVVCAALITPLFLLIDLRYAMFLGPLAGVLNLVPYIGLALGILPPILVALADKLSPLNLGIIAVWVFVVHFVAVNILTPKLVGRRLKLNALSVTIGMMFWGWLWGGIGLVLAVPITAALKAICDNVSSLKPYGAWMGES